MKKQSIFLAMLALVLAFGIMFVACDSGIGSSTKETTKTIKYQLTGTIPSVYSINYRNATGGYDNLDNVTLPWEVSFPVTIGKNEYFYAAVSGTATTKSTLTAKIFVNGTEVKSVNSSGDTYTMVSATEMIRN